MRAEFRTMRRIFRNWNTFAFYYPLVSANDGVNTEVNEHAEVRSLPPLHACRTVRISQQRSRTFLTGLRVLQSGAFRACR
jgi:hypothetical protein